MPRENRASDKLLVALERDELRFNSATLEELSNALQDGSINIIGLHGRRGSGKTTLVGLVRDKVKSLKMFDAVLFVSMSKIRDSRKIRDRIAEELNQIFGREKELKSALGTKGILVILDDVWAKFDPWKCMGTSQSDLQFKFLLTARTKREIPPCTKMIRMGRLSSEDTWRLLQKYSGIEDDESNNVAIEIGFNDKWFPGSTIEIGSFLKDRPRKEWKGILYGLRLQALNRYDIYLSFRGDDTKDFKSALCHMLRKKGLTKIFENDTKLGDVDSTSPEHLKAIEDSILSIVILSENYVGSAKCLDELVHIIYCMKTRNKRVWPIYYTEDSLYIKRPKDLGSAQKLKEKMIFDPDKTEVWKQALRDVSTLSSQYNRFRVSKLRCTPLMDDIFVYGSMLLGVFTYYALRSFLPPSLSRFLALTLFCCSACYSQELFLPGEWRNGDCEFDLFLAQGLLMALRENELCFDPTTLEELSEAIQDDDDKTIIGLYGQKGSGKTTLVKAVRDKVKRLKLFDVVLFATVYQNPNIKSIQHQIARSLDLKFVHRKKCKRAMEIELKLESIKRILVILDDVPPKFDIEYIGIPCNNGQCKFLLTTGRSQNCSLMISDRMADCQRMISMRHLPKEEAWKLLQKHSGIKDDDNYGSSSNLFHVAEEIASKYKWLPRTIMERGSFLKGKPYDEWEGLLNSLKHSSARYQIFLSFRGEDTRLEFVSTLYAELKRNKFKTFMDDTGVRKGRLISEELKNAIKDSRLSIVILSENYADSRWCLQELVYLLHCKHTKKQLVLPVFYNVRPTDVRRQTGAVREAIARLEANLEEEERKNLKKWKKNLKQVCALSGEEYIHTRGMSQHDFIQKIINWTIEHQNYLYLQSMAME